MRYAVFILLILLPLHSWSQQQQRGLRPVASAAVQTTGITRAVIVGISDYQNEDITDLQYADVDASVFADYLVSVDGWALDTAHVRLLLNAEATSGTFISALYGLIQDSQEGDRVVIYFAGHGDVETTTMSQPGFLLCWDAPASVYMAGGTFPLTYLQDIVSTLSVQKGVQVLVVTDACRSGNLAGSGVGGAQATAVSLSQQYANETKILSCQPDEYALEGPAWGGGRGVFSYYLLAGLKGLADVDQDGNVDLKEIERYLEDHVSASVAPHSQNPLTVGNRKTVIAEVRPEVLAMIKESGIDAGFGIAGDRAVALTAASFRDSTDYDVFLAYQRAMDAGHYLYPYEGSAYEIYRQISTMDDLSQHINLIKRNLAAALQDEAQQAINDYLAADPAELRARWQYDDKYDRFPVALQKAAELLGEEHFFYNTIEARALYFEGLTYRLRYEWTTNDSLVTTAIVCQQASLDRDSLAPHTLNELGLLYGLIGQRDLEYDYHQRAVDLSPEWILGKSNICASQIQQGKYQEAIKTGREILQKDSTFLFNLSNLANAYHYLGKRDSALLLLYRAIDRDTTYGAAYDQLGVIYNSMGDHTTALQYYQTAADLLPHRATIRLSIAQQYLALDDTTQAKINFEAAYAMDDALPEAIQGLIEYDYHIGNYTSAKVRLEAYLAIFPTDGFAHFLLSSIYAHYLDVSGALAQLGLARMHGFDQWQMVYDNPMFDSALEEIPFRSQVDSWSKE